MTNFKVMIGEDTLLRFSGVPLGEACSIVIRGATQQIIDEAERSLHDALCVLATTVRETKVCFGGGKNLRRKSKLILFLSILFKLGQFGIFSLLSVFSVGKISSTSKDLSHVCLASLS